MVQPSIHRFPPTTASRRRQVEARLRDRERLDEPRGVDGAADGTRGRRLRAVLAGLGPVFASYGAYLSSRLDLLGPADALALRGLPAGAEPTPAATVRALVAAGAGQGRVLGALDETPLRCDLAGQVHRARLAEGAPVLVWLAHPDLPARLTPDAELLPLAGALLGEDFPAERAAADFLAAVARRADLGAQAAAFAVLGEEAARRGWLRLPWVEPAGERVLLLEDLGGVSLGRQAVLGGPAAAGVEAERADLARRACRGWLRSALAGRAFPAEIAAEDLRLLPDGSLGLALGVLASLSPAAQAGLSAYLEAAAGDDPGAAAAPLLRLLEPSSTGTAEVEAELRRLFRQAVPWRLLAGAGDEGLAGLLLAQWRLAGERGLHLVPAALDFHRGLDGLTAAIRPLGCGGDPLLAALADARLADAFERFSGLADPWRLRRTIESYAVAFADLPEALDRALDLAADGKPRVRLDLDPARARERRRDGAAAAIALLAALAAVVLLTQRMAASSPWAEGLGAAVYLVIGALLLRLISRQG